tara:strand:+ start:178 stop:495 length:318 start_codon:yes stop_codon:yes gene_type:complete
MPNLKEDFNLSSDEEPESPTIYTDHEEYTYLADSSTYKEVVQHIERKWYDSERDNIYKLWTRITNWCEDEAIPILEEASFLNFLEFVCKYSKQKPFDVVAAEPSV